ncbi:MAG TPA: metallopeptidase family protein [Longimicrobiales bacterium]
MRFDEFERRAWRDWREIPEMYKEGIDGLIVERGAQPHPTLPDIYTLGECITEAYPSEYGGPETIRSAVVLYYGSFRRLAALDPDFDWDEEIWETLTHELKHHLESLADEDALGALDYAVDENFKRLEGEPFDPLFYRSGELVAPGVWRVERDTFIEQAYPAEHPPGAHVEFGWHGEQYRVARPAVLGDICFLRIGEGLETGPGGEVYVVLVRRRGAWASLRAALGRERPEVVEAEGRAERSSRA